jgi:ABC-type transport system substrate-binding protein
MKQHWRAIAAAGGFLAALSGGTAVAQKAGGILKMYHFDSPASLSLHEEVTYAALGPAMGLFNNLVMFDQHVPQASLQSIVPDLATEWSWDSSKTELSFRLRGGVKWHDGRPFTANDVKCTWDTLLGKSPEKFRLNPRKAWYQNLEEVTTKGDDEVAFHLKRPQPSFIALLASGWSAVYPCHGSSQDRDRPRECGARRRYALRPGIDLAGVATDRMMPASFATLLDQARDNFNRRKRMVVNSAVASAFVAGIASRTVRISQ